MNPLKEKRILVGVCGGIAAYKTPLLVRLLRQADAEVQVVMTASAKQFVTPTTLQAVSGHPVRDTLWDPAAEAQMGHIELARWADLVVVAPATADRLSRMASGHADDLLGALTLATRAPVYVAPAMNQAMWEAPATQRNLAILRTDGVNLIGPESGEQACGEVGPGRMSEPEAILLTLIDSLTDASARPAVREVSLDRLDSICPRLAGCRVVITAGPTREALDPVRYITNHSSGKQGYAMARAARDAGAEVTLISGPVTLSAPNEVRLIPVESARQMYDASLQEGRNCDLFIAVAAVADYRPTEIAPGKIKKSESATGLTLEMVENPDVVAAVAALPNGPVVVGFAAETHQPLEYGRAKLTRKGLDAIVVNDVSKVDIGFESDDNAATLISRRGEIQFAKQDKYQLSCQVIEHLATLFVDQLAHTNPENVAN